ncbi:transcriptional regulator [Escherichia coli]|nr:transcriptional regulator [Escherichia coli]ASF04872.1 transcriptional regulator [Escherichia coli O104:H4]EFO3117230.1 transcriptional regulator [Escherichia coli O8]EFO3146578.1 transcriptional regulator [Escherichia coli O19]EHX92898.1 DNA-binding transcriptional repressor FabR [Escherichia coli DEC15A]EHX99514.1 DNA-binding transcriptional repressor FabR [Escherichia coli DEC15B]EHY02328.1 DNA-binding transcriptional repressor FabR [Escherichia coli DEC15C]EHY10361.1 DNA-binding trans
MLCLFLTFALTFYGIFIDDTLRLSGRFPLYVKEPAKELQ